ncbi:MAG: tetratricopeptide repeat protein, partial [Chloroflexota bacterium]|nr:tetratricopeptide repeat protein [Chloroflexota bacterium]
MTIHLTLRTDENNRLTVTLNGEPLTAPTPLAAFPALPALQAAPYDVGRALTDGLGGDALLARLQSDPDRTLLLHTDDPAAAVPWEFAAMKDGRQLLACRYPLLRLVDRPADPAPPPDTLRFLVLGADPLVDDQGQPRERRLRINAELGAIRRALNESKVDLTARRIPPTADALHTALLHGPAILHLSCHGSVVETEHGPMAMLLLEDDSGRANLFHGPDLANLPNRGVLRLIVLSACETAQGGEATLARALVQNGVPAATGMQGGFPDSLSDDFAVALYRHLLAGHSLAEAVRQTRVALSHVSQDPAAAGQPVCYVARDAWGPLPLAQGRPDVTASLRLPGQVHLPTEVQAPDPLRGRNAQLHALARLYGDARVVTVVGTGGVGKTALAAAFAERFGWRWPDGILALSFAAGEPNADRFRADLLRGLLGESVAQQLAGAPPGRQARLILERLRDRDGLLLLDNYESILQGLGEQDEQAIAIHQLVAQAARGGASLLLTSRQQPAKLAGERVFPRADRPLPGLDVDPAAALFLHHSPRAQDEGDAGHTLARQVAGVTGGHPLAIALLGGEYDLSPVSPADFLSGWAGELAHAQDYGLAEHHRTFSVAFDRSYNRLTPALQTRLRALSRFPFPFFAQAAALVWGLSAEDDHPSTGPGQGLAAAREDLRQLTHRNLLQVDARFDDHTPATYRFQPALQQALAWRVTAGETPALDAGFAAYGAWLARRGYGDIHKDIPLARIVRLSLDALDAASATLEGVERLWHIRRLAWLKNAYGQTGEAHALLESVLPPGQPPPDAQADPEAARVASSLRYEMANLCVTRGDLDRALALYQESLQIDEQIGDIQGQAASLHQMAQVYLTQGDLDRALALYQESLQIKEQIGDIKGKAASLSNMAQVYLTRGDLDRALALYQESLQLLEQIGDIQGQAASLHAMAQVYVTRGDLDRALALYQESLQIDEQIGDIKGKAASLSMMAQVYVTRGDLDRALALYQESLQLK